MDKSIKRTGSLWSETNYSQEEGQSTKKKPKPVIRKYDERCISYGFIFWRRIIPKCITFGETSGNNSLIVSTLLRHSTPKHPSVAHNDKVFLMFKTPTTTLHTPTTLS